jgi:hypothetical protein
MKRTSLLSLAGAAAFMLLSANPVLAAQCGPSGGNFQFTSPGPWPLYTASKSGEECQGTFRAGVNTHFKRLFVLSPPQRGTIRLQQGGYYYYRSQPGFRGIDSFSLRICGVQGSVEGCTELAMRMQVN